VCGGSAGDSVDIGLTPQVLAGASGGILKRYIKERERENLIQEPGEEPTTEEQQRLYFGRKQEVRKHRKI
jgi:hypothetical protein